MNQISDLPPNQVGNEVIFHCVFCGARLQVASQHGGKAVECPHCLRRAPVPPTEMGEWPYIYPAPIIAMELIFSCSECSAKLRVDAKGTSASVNCPACHKLIQVPN